LNISALSSQEIAEKLERLQAVQGRPLPYACLMWRQRCLWRCRRSIGLIETCKVFSSAKSSRSIRRLLQPEPRGRRSLSNSLRLTHRCAACLPWLPLCFYLPPLQCCWARRSLLPPCWSPRHLHKHRARRLLERLLKPSRCGLRGNARVWGLGEA